MRISAKSRYALAATTHMGLNRALSDSVTLISISEALGISKIYLEQVFALLKRGNIVVSTKGSSGGYQLKRSPEDIKVLDILTSIETSLFEKTEKTLDDSNSIELATRALLYDPLDLTLSDFLDNLTLQDIIDRAKIEKDKSEIMFYI